MQRIAKFEKVSEKQFLSDMQKQGLEAGYAKIRLPLRATAGSAGYDFCTPVDFKLEPGQEITIPTGIRAQMQDGWVLVCCPRSGLGFKFRLQLNNTVGIIDSDYYHADNEGHIMARLINDGRSGKTVELKAGQAFMQGLFLPYGITVDDEAGGLRTGGFGSTNA